ncbi:MAG TPA: GtrA family protein [Candidatus Limnocylindrales bacterium]
MTARTTATARPILARLPAGLAERPLLRQATSFGAVGAASTLAYVALYALLRTASPAAVANAMALGVTAIGNTAANRRLTFGVRGHDGLARDHAAGLLAFGAAVAITSASLALLGRLAPGAGRSAELVVLVVANGLATVARFGLLRLALDRTTSSIGSPAATTTHSASRPSPTLSVERIAR